MAISNNSVGVPSQSKSLDTSTVTTSAGLVHRQAITISDPETPTSYARITGNALNVVLAKGQNTKANSVSVTIASDQGNIPVSMTLPAGAATEVTLQSIDTKVLTDTQLRASPVPVSGTFFQATQPVSFTRLSSGTDSVTIVPSGTQTVTGTVAISNATLAVTQSGAWSTDRTWALTSGADSVTVTGTVTANTGLSQPLTDTQLRASTVLVRDTDRRNLTSNFSSTFSPLGELLQQAPIRLVGQAFSDTTLDTQAWATSGVVGTGAVTLSGDSSATLSTGATANSAIVLSTTKSARFMFGHANMFRAIIKTADAGTANNVRRIGVGSATDGMGFLISGTSFGVFYTNNSVTTDILTGFNGVLGSTYTWTTTAKALEIVYFSAGYWFFVDGQLLHKIALDGLSSPLIRSLAFPIRISNTNSGGSTTNVSLNVWNASVFRLGNDNQRPNFLNLNTNATTVLKRGAGTLRRVVINTNGVTNNTLTIYDNTAASGTIIATINTTAAVGGVFEYNLDFSIGLTAVLATGTAANITIMYD